MSNGEFVGGDELRESYKARAAAVWGGRHGNPIKWTDAKIDELLTYMESGATIAAAANKFHCGEINIKHILGSLKTTGTVNASRTRAGKKAG